MFIRETQRKGGCHCLLLTVHFSLQCDYSARATVCVPQITHILILFIMCICHIVLILNPRFESIIFVALCCNFQRCVKKLCRCGTMLVGRYFRTKNDLPAGMCLVSDPSYLTANSFSFWRFVPFMK